MERVTRYFQVEERGSTVRTEVRGGLATFFTVAGLFVLYFGIEIVEQVTGVS